MQSQDRSLKHKGKSSTKKANTNVILESRKSKTKSLERDTAPQRDTKQHKKQII